MNKTIEKKMTKQERIDLLKNKMRETMPDTIGIAEVICMMDGRLRKRDIVSVLVQCFGNVKWQGREPDKHKEYRGLVEDDDLMRCIDEVIDEFKEEFDKYHVDMNK